MRTKTLICAAVLAAGVATSMAQANVYSLNVVGYVNYKLIGGGSYNLIANPLNNTAPNGNSISNLFKPPTGRDGDSIYRWDTANAGLDITTVYVWDEAAAQWKVSGTPATFDLKPGEGVFYVSGGGNDYTNTYVGDVIQGAYTNVLVGQGAYNLVGSSAPIGGRFTNSIGGLNPIPLAGHDGDTIYTWSVANTEIDVSLDFPVYDEAAGKWKGNSSSTVDPNINIAIAEGFFYINTSGAASYNWVRNFTVQ